jgi:acetyltransferase-like isoleucine patch superfamily enzyme
MIRDVLETLRFWWRADRLGPDLPFTHWRLYAKLSMVSLCQRKFQFFGDNAEFRAGAYAICCSRIRIGRNVVVRVGSMLSGDPNGTITIEDDVLLGPGVHVYVDNHRFDDPAMPIIAQGYSPSKSVVIKRGSWIGANSIILPGVTIGENAVVGAGSVVTKSVPDRSVVAGNPAKIIRYIKRVNDNEPH